MQSAEVAKKEALSFGSSHLTRQAKAEAYMTTGISDPAVKTATTKAHTESSKGE